MCSMTKHREYASAFTPEVGIHLNKNAEPYSKEIILHNKEKRQHLNS